MATKEACELHNYVCTNTNTNMKSYNVINLIRYCNLQKECPLGSATCMCERDESGHSFKCFHIHT